MRYDKSLFVNGPVRRGLEASQQRTHSLISRRRFMATTAGASLLGAGLLRPRQAFAGPGIGNVLPTPNTLDLGGGVKIHVQLPPLFSGPDSDLATIWNFQGNAAVALMNTTATQTDRRTGAVRTGLNSQGNHMAFMQGVYRGRDGHTRDGTFGFI